MFKRHPILCQLSGVLFTVLALSVVAGCASTVEGLKADINQMMGKNKAADNSTGQLKKAAAKPEISAQESMISDIQSSLAKLGYNPGPITGKLNSRTEAAIQDFQLDNDLKIDGKPSKKLLELLKDKAGSV